jgi:dephospho-CoA kinase
MQKLYKFAFCGKMGSGKTTAMQMVAAILQNKYGENNTTAFHLKFAGPIYRTLGVLHVPGKPRVFMQLFGDLCRKEFGDDVFEKALEVEYTELLNKEVVNRPQEHVSILIDDVRFVGEAELLKKLGFKIIKVEAKEDQRKIRLAETFENITHRSETELESIDTDVTVDNNLSYMELHKQIKELLD